MNEISQTATLRELTLRATLETYKQLLSEAVLPYQQARLETAIASIQRKLDKAGN